MQPGPAFPQTVHEGEVVRLTDLAVARNVIQYHSFYNCLLLGPAVLVPTGYMRMSGCGFGVPDLDTLFWEIPPTRIALVGGIAIHHCEILDSNFTGVGFAGSLELRGMLSVSFEQGEGAAGR